MLIHIIRELVSLKVKVNITQSDAWNFSKHNILHNSRSRLDFFINVLSVPIFIAFMLYAEKKPTFNILIVSILSIPLACFIMLFIIKRRVNRSVLKSDGVLGEHTIEISEEGLREKTEVNDNLHLWKGIIKVQQNNDYIYIYIAELTAHIIPKISFSSKEEANVFFDTTLRYWNDRR